MATTFPWPMQYTLDVFFIAVPFELLIDEAIMLLMGILRCSAMPLIKNPGDPEARKTSIKVLIYLSLTV